MKFQEHQHETQRSIKNHRIVQQIKTRQLNRKMLQLLFCSIFCDITVYHSNSFLLLFIVNHVHIFTHLFTITFSSFSLKTLACVLGMMYATRQLVEIVILKLVCAHSTRKLTYAHSKNIRSTMWKRRSRKLHGENWRSVERQSSRWCCKIIIAWHSTFDICIKKRNANICKSDSGSR